VLKVFAAFPVLFSPRAAGSSDHSPSVFRSALAIRGDPEAAERRSLVNGICWPRKSSLPCGRPTYRARWGRCEQLRSDDRSNMMRPLKLSRPVRLGLLNLLVIAGVRGNSSAGVLSKETGHEERMSRPDR